MRVVLRKDVPKLGKAGEVREVADGYGRNYLIPHGLAAPASKSALANAAAQQAAGTRVRERLETEQRALAQRIEGTHLVVHAATGQGGRLYGSITSADIADALQKAIGESIDKRDIDLDAPIRHLGEQSVRVHVGPGIAAALTVAVEAEGSA